MNKFYYKDGTLAEIKENNNNASVFVTFPDGRKIEVSGFPDGVEAAVFIMFGDFKDEYNNNFVSFTRPPFNLVWKFGDSNC